MFLVQVLRLIEISIFSKEYEEGVSGFAYLFFVFGRVMMVGIEYMVF